MEPIMSTAEAEAAVEQKTAPRVTRESIQNKIYTVEYARPFLANGMLTVCCITMKNGFSVTGISAPASPANFDALIGERYAYDNAFKQLWQLEGYLLKDQLTRPPLPPAEIPYDPKERAP
jgi:hypothetical protein